MIIVKMTNIITDAYNIFFCNKISFSNFPDNCGIYLEMVEMVEA